MNNLEEQRISNHKLKEENLKKLKMYERDNIYISFDLLSRVAFIINASKNQPILELTNKGTMICTYPSLSLIVEVKPSTIELTNDGKTTSYDDNKIIPIIKELTS